MSHGERGEVLDVGRRNRTVPTGLRRALEHRDRGCRFPGCGNRFCDAHHIDHWCDGGETRIDNLVLLCRRHHRAVHEGGFEVRVQAGTELGEDGCGADGACGVSGAGPRIRFYRPDGKPLDAVPSLPTVPSLPGMPPLRAVPRLQESAADLPAPPSEGTRPLGFDIEVRGTFPGWDEGRPFDLGLALEALRPPLRGSPAA